MSRKCLDLLRMGCHFKRHGANQALNEATVTSLCYFFLFAYDNLRDPSCLLQKKWR